tara:strand:- start:187 stop:564 length:378 start_codon:yes stop_codon:yes gene_type:complete
MDKKEKKEFIGELWFDEKTESLHIKGKTGFDSTKWRNLDQEIEKNLEEHFKEHDPYKRKYYARKGFYQQLTAAEMMGLKSENALVKYRKNGVLKEDIHWVRTVGRGISYKPELCKLAIRKEKLGY